MHTGGGSFPHSPAVCSREQEKSKEILLGVSTRSQPNFLAVPAQTHFCHLVFQLSSYMEPASSQHLPGTPRALEAQPGTRGQCHRAELCSWARLCVSQRWLPKETPAPASS